MLYEVITVLANEQVIAGECERCSTAVEQRRIAQWFFKITNVITSYSIHYTKLYAQPPAHLGNARKYRLISRSGYITR